MGSVSHWIAALRQNDPQAATQLWNRYAQQVMQLARSRLPRSAFSLEDEEDTAVAVFELLYRGVANQQFPELNDRSDLWGLLIRLTETRAIDQLRKQQRQKRGGGQARSPLRSSESADGRNGVPTDALHDHQPTPEVAAAMADECRFLLECLDDALLRTIAVMRLNGHDVDAIAGELNRPLRTIERKLQLIRKIWKSHQPPID